MCRYAICLGLSAVMLLQPGCSGGDSQPASDAGGAAPVPAATQPPPPPPPPPPPASQPAEQTGIGPGTDQPAEGGAAPPATLEPTGDIPPGTTSTPVAESGTPEDRSLARLKLIAEAMAGYSQQHERFPAAATYDAGDRPLLSWRVALLPFLGREDLYRQFHLDEPWDSPHNRPLADRMPDVYQTPGGPPAPKTCYLAATGMGSVFSQREGMRCSAVRDGLPNTLVLVEADSEGAVVWTEPRDWRFIQAQPFAGLGGLRGGAFLAAAGDGRPHKIPGNLEPQVVRALFTADGRDPVDIAALAGGGPGQPGVQAGGELLARAQQAFKQGRELQGAAYLMADAVVRADPEVLGAVGWSPAMKRPMLLARWGIATQSSIPMMPPGDGAWEDNEPRPVSPIDFWSRLVGQPLLERIEARVAEGYFGRWLRDARQPAAAAEPEGVGAVEGGPSAAGPVSPKRLPGIVVMGLVHPAQLRPMALREGLDVIVIAGIAPKFDRQGLPRTILVLRIFDVVKDKELYASTPLSSLLVGSALQAGAAVDDPSSALIDEVMKFVDENLRLTEMRRISREAALRRAAAVTSQKYPNPLPVLMELRYYQWKELLTSEELAQHYTKLIGDDGQRLATGTEAQRRLVIEQFLPRE